MVTRGIPGPDERASCLDTALASLRHRYGPTAVQGGRGLSSAGLRLGVLGLDELNPAKGIPVGRLSWLSGAPGDGPFDLGLVALAVASRIHPVALVDMDGVMNPGDVRAYGGDLDNCWVVRPRRQAEGWAAARSLVEAGVEFCLLASSAWDSVGAAAPATLTTALESGSAAAMMSGGRSLPLEVATRVSLEITCRRLAWTRVHRDISGLWLHLEVTRSRIGSVGRSSRLQLALPRPYAAEAGVVAAADDLVGELRWEAAG